MEEKSWEKTIPLKLTAFTFIDGFFMGIYGFLYNLFLKELGFSSSFVGDISAYSQWGTAIISFVLGFVSSKLDKRKALISYFLLSVFFGFYRLLDFSSPRFEIVSFLFGGFSGITGILVYTSVAQIGNREKRGKYLGLTFGLGMFTGVTGNLLGGFFGQFFGIKNALIVVSLLRVLALIPIWKIEFPRLTAHKVILTSTQKKVVLYYLLSTASVGFGAGLFVGFGNVIFYDLFKMSIAVIGIILAVAQLMTSVGSILSHKIAKKIGEMRLLIFSYVVVPILIASLSFVREPITFTTVYVLRFAVMNMVNPVFNNIIFSFLPPNVLVTISGINQFVNNSARAVSANVFASFSGLKDGYSYIFAVSSIFYVLNAYFMIRIYKQLSLKETKQTVV